MKDLLKKAYNILDNRFYFKILYLFVSLTFVTILIDIPGIKIFNTIALAWGMLLILFMIIEDRKRRKFYKFDIPLIIFMGLTLIFNLTIYINISNIKIWIVNLILVSTVFTIDVFKNKKVKIKEMNTITYFYCIFMFIASFISLCLRFSGKMVQIGDIPFGGTRGIFVNENALSIASAIAIVMCIYLNSIAKNNKLKIFWMFNIVLQAVTMLGSKGRSALLIVIAVIYLFIFVYYKNKYIRGLLIILPIIICGSFFALSDENTIRVFTSGRNSLWTSSSIVIKNNPLTGVGYSDFVEAVKEARDTTDLPGLETGGLHNIYMQTATINGVICLILLLLFLSMAIFFIIKNLDGLKRKEKLQMTTITSMLVGILAVNLFESNLLYVVSFISIIFWIYLGYLISILDNKNIE